MLDPARVIVFGGSYWEPSGRDSGLDAVLSEATRPLMRTGSVDGRVWVVGWHPTGASYRGFGPMVYAEIVRETVASFDPTRTTGDIGPFGGGG
jgi:hypothetical protein